MRRGGDVCFSQVFSDSKGIMFGSCMAKMCSVLFSCEDICLDGLSFSI